MKAVTYKSEEDQRILYAMIVDDLVLGRISSYWKEPMFTQKLGDVIGKLCVDFYNLSRKAPKEGINDLVRDYADSKPYLSEEEKTALERLVGSLTSTKQDLNPQVTIELAAKYFDKNKIRQANKEVDEALAVNNPAKARSIMMNCVHIDTAIDSSFDPLIGRNGLPTFTEQAEDLFTYPQGAGEFFKDTLTRDAFISFMGPEKIGKTFWLMDIAARAVSQRRKVLFIEAGDMSIPQVDLRFVCRFGQLARKDCTANYPLSIKRPPKTFNDEGKVILPTIEYESKKFRAATEEEAQTRGEKFMRTRVKSLDSHLKVCCYPANVLSVAKIKSLAEIYEASGFLADVIVIDYADILDHSNRFKDQRDNMNKTWAALRALSQERHCLVVTATQGNRASYTSATIHRTHLSEDKRKLSHVTGMVGINRTKDEWENGVYRLNWVAHREKDVSPYQFLYTASCLAIANPCVVSAFLNCED